MSAIITLMDKHVKLQEYKKAFDLPLSQIKETIKQWEDGLTPPEDAFASIVAIVTR